MASDTATAKAKIAAKVGGVETRAPSALTALLPDRKALDAITPNADVVRGASIEAASGVSDFFRSPLRTVARRIVAINLVGLAILVAGVLYLNQLRSELINLRVQSLQTQATILATGVAELATEGPDANRLETNRANAVLRQLTLPIGQRAQLYVSGRLIGDTRSFAGPRRPVERSVCRHWPGLRACLGGSNSSTVQPRVCSSAMNLTFTSKHPWPGLRQTQRSIRHCAGNRPMPCARTLRAS